MTKLTLTSLANLQNETTAVSAINANSTATSTALENTLSRDGTSPNTMGASLDMNSNQIINLPTPATSNSPLRFSDLNSFIGGGTITSIPSGGTVGQNLVKLTGTDYDVGWASTETLTATTYSGSTSGTTIVQASAVASGTLTFPAATDTLVGKATTDTLTNKTFNTASTGNVFQINGTGITAVTGTGSVVLGTSPTLTTPTITTSATVPLIIGGSATTGTLLTFQTTTGTGTTDQFVWKGGTNGATTFATLAPTSFVLGNAVATLSVGDTGGQSVIAVSGASTNATLSLRSKGTGGITTQNSTGGYIAVYDNNAGNTSAANCWNYTNSATGNPILAGPYPGAGPDSNVNVTFFSKGTGAFSFTNADTTTNRLVLFTAATASTTPSTGTAVVGGGLGVSGAIYGGTSLSAGIAGSAAGSVLLNGLTSGTVTVKTQDTAGTWTMKVPNGTGTNGQYLTTDGAGVTSWTTGSGGATSGNLVLLNTLTASNSPTLADTTHFTSTYDRYLIVFRNVLAATSATTGRLRVNVAGVQTTGYLSGGWVVASNAGTGAISSTTFITVGTASVWANTGGGVSGEYTLFSPSGTSAPKQIHGMVSGVRSDGLYETSFNGGSYTAGNGAITGIEFSMASGNITSGEIKIYGVI